MPDLNIVPLEHKHLAQTESWASSQNAAKTLLKQPVLSVGPTPDAHGWAALDDGGRLMAIAAVRFDKEHVGYLECMVKPSERRRGIGSEILEYVLDRPEIRSLIHLHAAVAMSNISAQKSLDEHGFTRTGYTDDGRMEFARHHKR